MPHYFPTVKDPVENFRRDLIKKEHDIGGLIDAPTVVCRYLQLQYSRRAVNTRCSCHSDFKINTLRIYFHHFNATSNVIETC